MIMLIIEKSFAENKNKASTEQRYYFEHEKLLIENDTTVDCTVPVYCKCNAMKCNDNEEYSMVENVRCRLVAFIL
jgi:hypothetical protein